MSRRSCSQEIGEERDRGRSASDESVTGICLRWCEREIEMVAWGCMESLILKHLLTSIDDERDYAIMVVLLDTGIRVDEWASITREGLSASSIRVSGKTGDRVVPILPHVYDLVSRQGDARGLWKSRGGHRGYLGTWGLKTVVRRWMRRAGFKPPKIGPHTLRHTFGTQYMLNGGDVFSLRLIVGHSKIETTMLYAEMSDRLVAEQHRKFSPMARLAAQQSFAAFR